MKTFSSHIFHQAQVQLHSPSAAVESPRTAEGQLSSLETLIEKGGRGRSDINLEVRMGRKVKKKEGNGENEQ